MTDKVVELASSGCNQGFHCWMCHEALSVRAMFCNNCGTIQPVRELSHFERLGLEKRVDVDLAALERNLATLLRTFAPERFMLRSHTEKNFAARHREAIQAAHDALHDPMARSRYWIDLHSDANKEASSVVPPIVTELQAEFEKAVETNQLDRLAQRTGHEIEMGIVSLLSNLRQQKWDKANEILVALDNMETLIVQVREKRQALTPHATK